MEDAKYECPTCFQPVKFDTQLFHFVHTNQTTRCAGGIAQRKLNSEFHTPGTIIGEVIEVKDEYASARPFTASAQLDPKPYGGPFLR